MKPHYASLARRLGGRAIIVSILASACAGAYAQAPPVDVATAHYSHTYRVPVTEAARRLEVGREAGLLGQRLRSELPDTFAGLYIEHEPEFRVVVQFTEDPRTKLAAYTRDPEFVAKVAPRSLELLLAVQEELGEMLLKAGVEFESGLDVKKSEINVYVLDPVVASRHLSRLLSITGFVRVHRTTGFIETTAISGGNRLTGPQQHCTSGFNVVETATRELGLTTAGHCDDDLTYDNPPVALVFQGEQDAGSYDVQWHTQPTSGTPEQQLNDITVDGSQVEITSETPSSALALGDTLCKSGITSGHTCGLVADLNAQSMYNGEIGTYIRVASTDGLPMTESGDSGGPVFRIDTAHGIVHGRGAGGTPTHNDMYFMPIERFAVLGISVLTEPFEIESIPDVTGSPPSMQVDVNFQGYPRFPVDLTVEIVTCPTDWVCNGGSLQYTTNIPSPLSFNWGCNPDETTPPLPAVVTVRTSLQDASGINPEPVEHNITCTEPAPFAQRSAPEGQSWTGLLDAD